MKPLSLFVPALAIAVSAGAAAPQGRPRPDVSAMNEALRSSLDEEPHASASSYAHYLKARLAHHDGDHQAAVDELRLALATDDGNPFLLTSLAEEYARLGDLGRSERELRAVLERAPGYAPAQLLMGRILMEGRKLARAQVHLGRAIRLRPRDPEAYLVLAQLHLERGAPEDAVRAVEALAQALPGEAQGYFRLGMALAERGDGARAEPLLKKGLERDPGDFEGWVALAQLYAATRRPGPAEDAYARALERDPDNLDALLAAGRLALRNRSPVRARACFDRLLSLSDDPQQVVTVAFAYLAAGLPEAAADALDFARAARAGDPRLAFYAGVVDERLHRYPQAAEAFALVPEGDGLFQEARLRRANALSVAGQHPRALELLRKAAAERPGDAAVLCAYARALERSGAQREAEQLLAGAVSRQRSAELVDALARHYGRLGRHADALSALGDALRESPKDEGLLFSLGAAYERAGDFERCLEKMRQVLALNPDNAMALNYAGYTLADRGRDLDEAEKMLKRALELRPETGEYLDSLGWLYFRRGDPARSVDLLQKAAELIPGDPLVLEHLGDAYGQASRPADAAEQYRRALQALDSPGDDDGEGEGEAHRGALERKLKLLSTQAAGR